MTKNGDFETALSVMERATENCENEGDLYYIKAQIYKMQNLNDKYIFNMNEALKHFATLSFPSVLIKKELSQ